MKFFKFLIFGNLLIISSCVQKELTPPYSSLGRTTSKTSTGISVSSVQIVNNQLVINGSHLKDINNVILKNDTSGFNPGFAIESVTDNQIVANGLMFIGLASDAVLDLIISSAEATATFNITLTPASASITASMLNSMGATSGQFLRYNGSTWAPYTLSIIDGLYNVGGSMGTSSFVNVTSGSENNAYGNNALKYLTTGSANIAVGNNSLGSNTVGSNNIAVGSSALFSNVGKNYSTAIGYFSMSNSDSDSASTNTFNTALGAFSLQGSSTITSNTGVLNTAIGAASLKNNTSGSNNLAVGASALTSNTSGTNNAGNGYASLYNNTIGSNNIGIGNYSLFLNSVGNRNTSLGVSSLYNNNANSESTAIGYMSMYYANNTTTESLTKNTAVGAYSLQGGVSPSSNIGTANTAIGHKSLYSNTGGGDNTSVGSSSLISNSQGNGNVALGSNALYANTSGSYNIGIGAEALKSVTIQSNNIGIGYRAGSELGTSYRNIVIIGGNDGSTIDDDGQVLISNGAGVESIRINKNKQVGIGTTDPSYALDVSGDINASGSVKASGSTLSSDKNFKKEIHPIQNALENILKLKGVTFLWKWDEFPKRNFDNKKHFGFIAQEVEKVFPDLVNKDHEGYLSVEYANITSLIVESIKEMWTQFISIGNIVKFHDQKIKALEMENKLLKEYLCSKDPKATICSNKKIPFQK
jgi:hypothetical protein